jgi:Mn2+/Fe2+ NRAMP family transporter
MDYLGFIKGIITQIIEVLKSIIEIAKPILTQVMTIVFPIIVTIFTFIIGIDYYGIATSKPFIGFMLFLVFLFFTYAYLSMYQPKLFKKIINFLTLKPPVPKKNKFKFNSSVDISIETK